MPSLWSKLSQSEKEDLIGQDDPKLLNRIQRVLSAVLPENEGAAHLVYLPNNLVRLLDAFLPSTSLSDRDFRKRVLNRLSPDDLSSLAQRVGITAAEMSFQELLERLCAPRWESTYAQQFIEHFGLPEHFLPEAARVSPNVLELKTDGSGYPEDWSRTAFRRLKGYQQGVYQEAMKRLETPRARFVIQMPTGSGKTRTAMEVVADALMKPSAPVVVWLAHAEELCEQAVECFLEVWSHLATTTLDLQRFWGAHRASPLVVGRPTLVVAGFQKLHSAISRGDPIVAALQSRTTLVVVDEAHKTLAPTFRDAVLALTSARTQIVGLTATPGRSTGDETRQLTSFYFNEKVDIQTNGDESVVEMLRRLRVLSQAERRPIITGIDVRLTETDKRELAERFDLPESVLKGLGTNDVRNIEIVKRLLEEQRAGRQVLFFACSVAHSKFITAILTYLGVKVGHIDGSTNGARRRTLIQSFKGGTLQVLCNYGVLTTGFDAPNTDVVFISRPTMSPVLYGQMIGRGLRGVAVGGTEKCIIIDVRDNLVGFGDDEQVYSTFDEYWSR